MKQTVEKRKPSGIVDYIALALTTFGVGYIPGAPGTYGSVVGVLIYAVTLEIEGRWVIRYMPQNTAQYFSSDVDHVRAMLWVLNTILLLGFVLIGIWSSHRSTSLLGKSDPSEAVVDEVMGQLVTFAMLPYGILWYPPYLIAGFLLFRLFDIWKPFPVRDLEILPGGLGICADDIVAGVYAGICLAVGYAVFLLWS